jgi:c-di-GMP-binding flagellar brake protein YcgR
LSDKDDKEDMADAEAKDEDSGDEADVETEEEVSSGEDDDSTEDDGSDEGDDSDGEHDPDENDDSDGDDDPDENDDSDEDEDSDGEHDLDENDDSDGDDDSDGEHDPDENGDDASDKNDDSEGADDSDNGDEPVERAETYQESVDRRQSGRKGVKLSRLISSKIIDGDSERECYLHLVDISDGGLRINSDDPFPEDRDFVLEIGLAPFGNELATKSPMQAFPVKVVWTKSLVGGMVVSGLAFQNLDQHGQEIVEAIMQGASPQGRRMHFRLNRVLGVELGKEEDEDQQWLYPLTLDLSVEGMRICLSNPLEVGATFPIKVFLEFELPTVKANAEVMWQETMPSGRVQVGLKFDDMSERDAMAIKTYIDQCLNQDDAHRRL